MGVTYGYRTTQNIDFKVFCGKSQETFFIHNMLKLSLLPKKHRRRWEGKVSARKGFSEAA